MLNLGKWLVIVGIAIAGMGGLIWLCLKLGFPFGKLPGDIHIHKEKFSFYMLISTSIVISMIITAILNLIFWLFRKL